MALPLMAKRWDCPTSSPSRVTATLAVGDGVAGGDDGVGVLGADDAGGSAGSATDEDQRLRFSGCCHVAVRGEGFVGTILLLGWAKRNGDLQVGAGSLAARNRTSTTPWCKRVTLGTATRGADSTDLSLREARLPAIVCEMK